MLSIRFKPGDQAVMDNRLILTFREASGPPDRRRYYFGIQDLDGQNPREASVDENKRLHVGGIVLHIKRHRAKNCNISPLTDHAFIRMALYDKGVR